MVRVPEYGAMLDSGLEVEIDNDDGQFDRDVYKFVIMCCPHLPGSDSRLDIGRFIDLPIIKSVHVSEDGNDESPHRMLEWRIVRIITGNVEAWTKVLLAALAPKNPNGGRSDGRLRVICIARKGDCDIWQSNGSMVRYSDPWFQEHRNDFRLPSDTYLTNVYKKFVEADMTA